MVHVKDLMERVEEMQRKLQEAAAEGDVASLLILFQKDKLVLHRCAVYCSKETPLHTAAMLGHLVFTREILCRNPELAQELDFHRSSPLHLATANGHLEVVKALLSVSADMCLVKDRDGWNPLHISVIKGRIDVLKELVHAKPEAIKIVGERGQTVLHLCVKHCQIEAMKLLIESIDDTGFVNAQDDGGLSILHQAVADREIEIINHLINETPIEINALNANGFTAMDTLLAQGRRNIKDVEIGSILREVGALSSKEIASTGHGSARTSGNDWFFTVNTRNPDNDENWLEEKRNALMVVASLIATMAFQLGISPPSGNWEADSQGSTTSQPHQAGSSIMADKLPKDFAFFVGYNTTSFLASVCVILLLISGLPFKWKTLMWILMIVMWMAVIAMTLTYQISISTLSAHGDESNNSRAGVVVVFFGVMGIILLGHSIRLSPAIFEFAKKLRARRSSQSAVANI